MRKRRLRVSARKTDPQQPPTEPPIQAATSAAIITRVMPLAGILRAAGKRAGDRKRCSVGKIFDRVIVPSL